jgi:2-polyprenyl-3-methyl-5-hydroxy-6-metoxy-1,4-benzoquinol methylase
MNRLHFTTIDVQGMHPEPILNVEGYSDESFPLNEQTRSFAGLYCKASGSNFASFIQERYVPGTWSRLAEYEHLPRYLFARELVDDRRVLDFGCGTGYGTALLAQRAKSVIGIDIDGTALEWARAHHHADNLIFDQRADLGAALPSGGFDLITCFEMIEHVPEELQIEAVRSFARLLSPDGVTLISTPNPEVTKLYGPNPFHIREMSRREFEDLLRKSFEFVEILEQYIQPMVLITRQPFGSGNSTRRLEWSSSEGRAEPAVFVAVCSHQELPALGSVCYLDFRTDFIAEQLQIMAESNSLRYARYQVSQEAAGVHASARRLEDELVHANQALFESRQRLVQGQQQLAALRSTNWYRLGDAVRRPGLSIDKLRNIAYYLGACMVPRRWKATLRRWVSGSRGHH